MISHEELVAALQKPGADLMAQMTPEKADLNHMALGVAGETGELIDAIKKYTMYDKKIDRENVIEELGDMEFYLQGIRRILGISREETLQANIAKLSKRYEGLQYTDKRAQDRADKTENK